MFYVLLMLRNVRVELGLDVRLPQQDLRYVPCQRTSMRRLHQRFHGISRSRLLREYALAPATIIFGLCSSAF